MWYDAVWYEKIAHWTVNDANVLIENKQAKDDEEKEETTTTIFIPLKLAWVLWFAREKKRSAI